MPEFSLRIYDVEGNAKSRYNNNIRMSLVVSDHSV